MATDKKRYMISVDDEMFKDIEDFRYRNRYPTRSEATTELLRTALALIGKSDRTREKEDASKEQAGSEAANGKS